ncbi:pimeloyl-ACP methyl ester esterase BioH [Colwellia sp. UCD-KL20]|uniref:pimeloyl-ACP methyl ester esterase BioH n=1 Tax=Colwellia sp. UCD-KL20 TaxID=1917165 RepID=UPI0009709B70|nr:pimeloyl-ACP methyl ester esterase BioH [Colwellia sp. UCD-KL20]
MSNSLITKKYISNNHSNREQKTPLVLIHGWGLNSAVWEPTIQKLHQHIDIITVDLPGFGLNINNPLADYSLINVVNEVQSAIDTPAIYVGWSLGGLVTTQLAYTFPEKVVGCVTVASSPCFLNKSHEEPIWPGILPNVLKMFYQQLAQNTQKTLEGFLKIQAMGSPHVRQDIKTIRELVMQHSLPTEQTLADSLQLLETVDLREQLSSLKMPFLRLYGKLDSLVPKSAIEPIDALLPHSQKHIFPKASHAPFISHPEAFNKVLLEWLGSCNA